jgi:hypothetical protein
MIITYTYWLDGGPIGTAYDCFSLNIDTTNCIAVCENPQIMGYYSEYTKQLTKRTCEEIEEGISEILVMLSTVAPGPQADPMEIYKDTEGYNVLFDNELILSMSENVWRHEIVASYEHPAYQALLTFIEYLREKLLKENIDFSENTLYVDGIDVLHMTKFDD